MDAPRPWLLAFDLDGTLIDSSLDLCLAVNATLTHLSLPALPEEQIAEMIGHGAEALVRRAVSAAARAAELPVVFSETALRFFLAFYREHKLDHTRPYPGVLRALAEIREAQPSLPMAVLTNKPVRPSVEICEALELAPFFFEVLGGNSLPTKKPEPDGLLKLMDGAAAFWRAHGVMREQLATADVWVLGDSEADVQTAQRVGARSLGCLYGLAPERLLAAGPNLLCRAPEEWPALVRALERC